MRIFWGGEEGRVNLTKLEICFLWDAISMHSIGPPDSISEDSLHPHYPDLILKIAGAMAEGMREGGQGGEVEVEMEFAWHELMLMREVAKTSVVVGGEKVGLNLAVKIAGGLITLAAERASGIEGVGGENEPAKWELRERIREFEKFEEEGS